jgi:hypothetical protein
MINRKAIAGILAARGIVSAINDNAEYSAFCISCLQSRSEHRVFEA